MWEPQSPTLREWQWSGVRSLPSDVLAGRHAVYDTVVERELRGTIHDRAAFAQVRSLQRLPVIPRTAPQTRWSKVVGIESRAALPPFFMLTKQPAIIARTSVLEAAAGLERTLDAIGAGTVLWAEPRWRSLLASALAPVLSDGTPEPVLVTSDRSTLLVCASRGEDEESVRARVLLAERIVLALEAALPPTTAR